MHFQFVYAESCYGELNSVRDVGTRLESVDRFYGSSSALNYRTIFHENCSGDATASKFVLKQ